MKAVSLFYRGLCPMTKVKGVIHMEIAFGDILSLGSLIVAVVKLCHIIFTHKK